MLARGSGLGFAYQGHDFMTATQQLIQQSGTDKTRGANQCDHRLDLRTELDGPPGELLGRNVSVLMPAPICFSHRLVERQAEARKTGFNPVFLGSVAAYTDLIHKLGGKAMDGMYATMTVQNPYLDEASPLRAEVVGRAFRGAECLYTLRLPGGAEVLALLGERIRGAGAIGILVTHSLEAAATADRVLADGLMDLVMVGRAHLANPHWPYHAALQLGEEKASWGLPAPYAHWLEKYRPTV